MLEVVTLDGEGTASRVKPSSLELVNALIEGVQSFPWSTALDAFDRDRFGDGEPRVEGPAIHALCAGRRAQLNFVRSGRRGERLGE